MPLPPRRGPGVTPLRLFLIVVVVLGGYLIRKYDLLPANADRPIDRGPVAEAPLDELPVGEPPNKDEPATARESPSDDVPAPAQSPPPKPAAPEDAAETIVRKVVVNDQNGKVVYRGDVDLGPTLARIAAGKRAEHRNDGATFQNREGRLPKKPSGYYKEYVHPTPGLSGPGPQRVVIGREGETYFTSDHYGSFKRVR